MLVNGFNNRNEDVYDDIINGKGKGLIFLLHGTPGLGKTLTTGMSSSVQKVSHLRRRGDTGMNSSESVAESARRPLCRVTTGELGADVEKLEKQLGDTFRLGGQMESSGIA
jgi:hypothetical protein